MGVWSPTDVIHIRVWIGGPCVCGVAWQGHVTSGETHPAAGDTAASTPGTDTPRDDRVAQHHHQSLVRHRVHRTH